MNANISKSRTIYLAHGDTNTLHVTKAMLEALDHDVPVVTDLGQELIRRSLDQPPDLIVAAPRLSDMDGIEAMIRIGEHSPVPGIVIARSDDLDKVERALEDHVMAYLVEPLTTETLLPAIYLAERRFEHFQQMVRRIGKLETRLEDRKIIERAKGIIMEVRGICESDAHRLLQTAATQKREKLAELAASVCQAGDLLTTGSEVE